MPDRIRRLIVEADGGSRGNPGKAAYGALVKDADTGEVLAEEGTTLGVASNNVAEYRGLIAGLTMAAEIAPDADVEVRMDSKLVVEQMSGNWKIKHPDMRPLAMEANRLTTGRRGGTTYTWVPREQNKHADRLANEALDGKRSGITWHSGEHAHPGIDEDADSAVEEAQSPEGPQSIQAEVSGYRGWSPPGGPVTTLILVRHCDTSLTADTHFSGGRAGRAAGRHRTRVRLAGRPRGVPQSELVARRQAARVR